jgi:hypothetical protein
VDGGARCHNGNDGVGEAARRCPRRGRLLGGEQVLDGEDLSGEQAIQGVKAEGAAPAQEIRDMRGLKAGLPGEESAIHTAAIDAAK